MAELFETKRAFAAVQAVQLPKGNMLRMFIENLGRKPDNTAFVFEGSDAEFREMSYREAAFGASFIAEKLRKAGVKQGDRVAVSIPPSPEMLCAVLGVLWIGAVYVPVSTKQPIERRRRIYEQADIRCCLATADSPAFAIEECVNISPEFFAEQVDVGDKGSVVENGEVFLPPYPSREEDTAYIIFTSGSTGNPKGVEIAHGSAVNTIEDIIQRFDIGEKDRAIGISALDFDLSVFDLFGMLSAGGSLAIIAEEKRLEPEYWKKLIEEQGVTLWNTVPALFEMLMLYSEKTEGLGNLRLVLVSGDWVKPKLFEALRARSESCRFIALGGATEASIWSNMFEVTESDPSWDAVPYGKALSNQAFRIVKDGKDTVPGERGELWIGGKGLAKGYVSAPEQTAAAFVMDGGERWYRTGDFGYFLPDGNIIFGGRQDSQVKLNGFRIELGEIDGRIGDLSEVSNSITLLVGKESGAYLASAVELKTYGREAVKKETLKQNISGETASVQFRVSADYAAAELMEKVLHGENGMEPLSKEELSPDGRKIVTLWQNALSQNALSDRKVIQEHFEENANEEDRAFRQELLSRMGIMREILTGARSHLSILDDELLAMEKLMGRGNLEPLYSLIVTEIFDCVKRAESEGRKARIVIVMGRGGENLLPVIKRTEAVFGKLELVYMETSDALLREAEHNFAVFPVKTVYLKSDFTHLGEELIGTADALVAINSLHLFRNVEKGLDFLKLMLRKNGCLLAGESVYLEPLGLISAAVVENGFSNYTDARAATGSPMLSMAGWKKALEEAGLILLEEDTESIRDFSIFKAFNQSDVWEGIAKKLRKQCEARLVSYMNPSKFYFAPVFPLTSNGKVDRNTIASWFSAEEKKGSLPLSSKTEKHVAQLMCELLKLTEVFADTDFFESGGDSLLAVRLINAVKTTFAIDITMREVFDSRTVAKIAEVIDARDMEEMDEGEL